MSDEPVSRLKDSGAEGEFTRFRIQFRRPGFKYEYEYRKTLKQARSCVDRSFRRLHPNMDPVDAVICGTTRMRYESPTWEMVETHENLLFPKRAR